MTPKTQSVCKHCGRPIKSGEYCRRHRNAESVSTGEPPDKSDEAFWKYLDENREVVIRWPGWMRGESILEAARPSGPSAPQEPKCKLCKAGIPHEWQFCMRPPHCPECKKPLRDETAWYRCDTCHARYSSSMERGLYRLPDDRFAAPQTSAELPDDLQTCIACDRKWAECHCHGKAAPQPVSGDAPEVEEIISAIAEKLAEKGFHRDCGNNNRLVIEHELETMEEVIYLAALRPYFPPASTARTDVRKVSNEDFDKWQTDNGNMTADRDTYQMIRSMAVDFTNSLAAPGSVQAPDQSAALRTALEALAQDYKEEVRNAETSFAYMNAMEVLGVPQAEPPKLTADVQSVKKQRDADLVIPPKPPNRTPENDSKHPQHKEFCPEIKAGNKCSHNNRPWKKA